MVISILFQCLAWQKNYCSLYDITNVDMPMNVQLEKAGFRHSFFLTWMQSLKFIHSENISRNYLWAFFKNLKLRL